MASRPVFAVDNTSYVRTIDTEFEFFNGFSKAQKQRSSESLHAAFVKRHPSARLLEVSSFSDNSLGNDLSAFNLLMSLKNGKKVPVEVAFQAGKVFEHGGPYKDLLEVSPKKAKKDPRLSQSGRIINFDFEGLTFATEPVTLFYTWLYLHALSENKELADQLYGYDAFTDIVFNPSKSVNCQAFACAVYVSLRRKNEFEMALKDIEFLSDVIRKTEPRSIIRSRHEPVKRKKVSEQTTNKTIKEERPTDGQPVRHGQEDKSVSLKKGEIIQHPQYGEGMITRIEESASGTRLLHVNFSGMDSVKRLSEKWVITNCKYHSEPASPHDEYENHEYEKIVLDDDNGDEGKFYCYQSKRHPFTEQIKKSIKLAEICFDREISFVILGDNVMMALLPGESLDISSIETSVQDKCDQILRNQPDFETITVEDKLFLVVMSNRMICIVPNDEKLESLSFVESIMHRQDILDACESRTIYGLVIGKEFLKKE